MITNELYIETSRLQELKVSGARFITDASSLMRAREAGISYLLEELSTVRPSGVISELRKNRFNSTQPCRELEWTTSYPDQIAQFATTASGTLSLGEGLSVGYEQARSFNAQESSSNGIEDVIAEDGTAITLFGTTNQRISCSNHTVANPGDLGVATLYAATGWPVFSDDTRDLRVDLTRGGAEVFTIPHLLLWGVGRKLIDRNVALKIFQESLLPHYERVPHINLVNFEQSLKLIMRDGFVVPPEEVVKFLGS